MGISRNPDPIASDEPLVTLSFGEHESPDTHTFHGNAGPALHPAPGTLGLLSVLISGSIVLAKDCAGV